MAAKNCDSVLAQLRAAALVVDQLVVGRLMRCRLEDDRERRGWYKLYEFVTSRGDVLLAGTFGVWHGTDNGARKIELEKFELTDEQRAAIKVNAREARKETERIREAEARRAAERARAAWAKCGETGESEYLARKGVGAYGVRYSPSGALVVPLLDPIGTIHGLQVIRSRKSAKVTHRPEKEFWPRGLAKKEHFHLLGMPTPGGILLIAEGYATAASLYAATQIPTAVAFDASNLAPVANALRKRYRNMRVLICADDDAFTADNPGVTSASAAAVAVSGAWVKPMFANEAARQETFDKRKIKLTDFNDLHALEGLQAVRAQIEARLASLKWLPVPASGKVVGDEYAPRPFQTLDELLPRFALVYGMKGTVFDRKARRLLALSDMRDACARRELHRAWMESPDREIVKPENVGFDPACKDPLITCNLWAGWPVSPRAGACEKLLDLLRHLCSADSRSSELFAWVLRWLAYPIQHPGAKMKTALVLHGPQGAGKNLFFENAIKAIYGPYGRVIDQHAIEDKFNDWASKMLFLIADEVVARTEIYHLKNRLKGFITGDSIRINPKGMPAYDERNHVNVVFLSNEHAPVALDEDDRRHCVIRTPDKLPREFYAAVAAEIETGGAGALHDYLLSLDLGDFHTAVSPPRTDAKQDLIEANLDSVTGFYYALQYGDLGGIRLAPTLSNDCYRVYKYFCGKTGQRPTSQPKMLSVLRNAHGIERARKRYMLDGLNHTSQFFVMFRAEKPVSMPETDWLGNCVKAWNTAASDYIQDAA